MSTGESAAELAEHVVSVRYEDLPDEVVAWTKSCILDTLAVMLAGSGTGDVAALHRIVSGWGGAPHSSIIGFGDKVPPPAAVLMNASMAHQYDFDDTHDTAVCHPTSATLSAGLAVGEAGDAIDGRELIAAVACGNDLIARLGLAIDGTLWDFAWVRAPVIGVFGATAAAGRMLGLDGVQMHEAFGLALPQAGGTLECLQGTTSAVRGIRDGLIYKDAILAATMAAEGLRGDAGTFDGKYGLFNAFFDGRYDRSRLTQDLGLRYEGLGVSLKPWPSCRHTHATLTALFDLTTDGGFSLDDVQEVEVRVGDGNQRLCQVPGDTFEGRMALLCNLPFAVGTALAHGSIPLSAFSEQGVTDPRTRAAMGVIRFVHDPEQNRYGTIEPGHVVIRLKDGTEREGIADRGMGHPDRPMTDGQVADKLASAAAVSVSGLEDDQQRRLIEAVSALEDVDDIGSLPALLAARG